MPRTMVLSRNFLDNTIVRGIGWAVQSIPTLGVTSIAVTVTIARGRWYCCWPEEPASNSSETTCRKHNALNDEALSHLKQLLAVKITFVTNADPSKAKHRFPLTGDLEWTLGTTRRLQNMISFCIAFWFVKDYLDLSPLAVLPLFIHKRLVTGELTHHLYFCQMLLAPSVSQSFHSLDKIISVLTSDRQDQFGNGWHWVWSI